MVETTLVVKKMQNFKHPTSNIQEHQNPISKSQILEVGIFIVGIYFEV